MPMPPKLPNTLIPSGRCVVCMEDAPNKMNDAPSKIIPKLEANLRFTLAMQRKARETIILIGTQMRSDHPASIFECMEAFTSAVEYSPPMLAAARTKEQVQSITVKRR
mmetsp:Transcript_80111/g.162150  ORF Transcript_80111/g.162150 Transcript_80111/m.162150 type:complete len:108 (+) Transcript_80111:429-752(+)